MIRINLLPHALRPVKRSALPHILSLAVLLLVMSVLGALFMGELGTLAAEGRNLEKAREDLAKLESVVAEHNSLIQEKVQLQDKIETIQKILADRTLWSEWLHQLASLTPENIWYSRVRLLTRKFQEERQKLDKKGQPEMDVKTQRPMMEKITVDRSILEVTGYAIEDESMEKNVSKLADSTTIDPKFSEKFTLYTSKIEDTDFEGFAVRKFTFEYQIR
ncbi:MAG: hypothetical protein GXY15_06110 [Candidatus Hydrogenedentes bacterium]|nr:hypothetical protein [Candidatus Hydrogenedentota bacterium]